jgi:hypothetical protein
VTFFEWPLSRKPTDVAAHRRFGNLHATLIEESLAMLPQGQVGIGLQLFGQPLPHKALPLTEALPGILWMFRSPVRRLLLSQRLMVDRETPKRSATSFLGMPRSIAASVFNLRSFE